MSLSWIISSNKQMKYETEENNHNRLNRALWNNTKYVLICMELCLNILLEMLEQTDTILCFI